MMKGFTRRGSFYLLRCVAGLLFALAFSPTPAQWVNYADATSTRLVAAASLGSADIEEKDYAWGDVDQDGDTDLVVVRKTPFTSSGKRPNVLLMNENGVLTDRTALYASESDVPGDQGFLTPTNDRDVLVVDLNGDGWLDIVTAVTISDGDPKHIGHPRIYINKGDDTGGNWQGFRHEDALIPTMLSTTGATGFNPRFCSVAAGDLTGDGLPELWFGDYDSSGAGGNAEPAGADFDDRLLINLGAGVYKDETSTRFSGLISIPNNPSTAFPVSAFGAAEAIADINGDGVLDIVKQTSLNDPTYVGLAYNDPANEGQFDDFEVVYTQSPYFVSVGDLNNDGRQDLVVTDDGQDRYLINQGNGTDGRADFVSRAFSYDAASDDGFGSDNLIADLNNDGWNDVLVADVDVDISGCTRRLHVYRNLGGAPGSIPTLQEQTSGSGCATSQGNPASCSVASIPSNLLEGVHDVAVFDINGDGWLDMVIGRCSGTQIWMNQPPIGVSFSYPTGLPSFVPPGQPFAFEVQLTGFGGAVPLEGSARMFASVDGGPFVQSTPTSLGGGRYLATLPTAAGCADTVRFYFNAQSTALATFDDPSGSPVESYQVVAATGVQPLVEDGIEGSIAGWTVTNDPSLSSGAWVQAVPVGTLGTGGAPSAPSEDADASTSMTKAFVTQNGAPGGTAGASDVDGGPTRLDSPSFDLSGTDGRVSVSRWFYTSGNDTFTISVSNDGGANWTLVETVTGIQNSWQVSSFRVGDHVTPTADMRVRFSTSDTPNNSVTEAAVDVLRVEKFVCAACFDNDDCSDGEFCNGAEVCNAGACDPGPAPCGGSLCDEVGDTCVDCFDDGDCDDGTFCNGTETCSANSCVPGADPCPGELCNEGSDICVDCLANTDCDDGVFCNGAEQCGGGLCFDPGDACPGQLCDEQNDLCVGNVQLQPQLGKPVLGLTGAEQQRFDAGRLAFDLTFTAPMGLGPIFNQDSCGSCHNVPLGGSGSIVVTRFGFNDDKGGGFDSLASLGGSLLQAQALSDECRENIPSSANVTAQRVTPSILGFGLVEAIPDALIQASAANPPPLVSGRVHMVPMLEDPGGGLRVGRFGWKSQLATLLSFSADASQNELGLTNRILTQENDPNGVDPPLLVDCDAIPDPEDGPDVQGLHFIDRVTDFQRFLAAPPQTPRAGMSGEVLFNNIGCASCHAPSFVSSNDPQLPEALRGKSIRPYSDFLLHDMGQAADFIPQGAAEGRELRTTPLWGLRVRDPIWHDGRVAGGTFNGRITSAISLHDALNSEGRAAAQAFAALGASDKAAVISFLDSLGRAEFDSDGDGDVDAVDYQSFLACFTGPGSFYTANNPCAISDVDQDGDVDDDDFDLFLAAADGAAGRVPDGATVVGVPLMVTLQPNGDLMLDWSASCAAGDGDYAVYEGTLGSFASHTPLLCSTAGATTATITPGAEFVYYLVVPTNGFREGSYGTDSIGVERPAGIGACLPQSFAACQ